jgi:hypothetical protein
MLALDGFAIISILASGLPISLIILAIVAASGRYEADPGGRRPYAIYMELTSFATLFAALFATGFLLSAIVQLALPEHAVSDAFGGALDPDKDHAREALLAGIIALASAAVFLFHRSRLRELEAEPGFVDGPARRSYQSYLYAVCFVAVVTLLVAGAGALYGLARVIVPGTTGFEVARNVERDGGITQLVANGVLALAAYDIFAIHWRHAGRLRPPIEPAWSPPEPVSGP